MSLQPTSGEDLNSAAIDGLAALLVLVQKLMPRGKSAQQWQQYHESAPTLVQPAFSHLQACANKVQELKVKSSAPCALYVGDVTPSSGGAGSHVVAGLYTLAEAQSTSNSGGIETIVTPLVSVHQAEFSHLSRQSYADRVVDTNVFNVSFNSAYVHAADTTPPLTASSSPYFDLTMARKMLNTSAALISTRLDKIKDQKEQSGGDEDGESEGHAIVVDPVLVRDILHPLRDTPTYRQYNKPSVLVGKKGVGKTLGLALAKISDVRDVQITDRRDSQGGMGHIQHQPGVVACNSFARMINEDSDSAVGNRLSSRLKFAHRSTLDMLIYETRFPSAVASGGMWYSYWQINHPRNPLSNLIQTSLIDRLNPSISYVPGFSISYGMDQVNESVAAQLKPRLVGTLTLIGSVLATVLNRFLPEISIGLLEGMLKDLIRNLTVHVGIVTGRPLSTEDSDSSKFTIDQVSPFRVVINNEDQNTVTQLADLKQAVGVIKSYEATSQRGAGGGQQLTKSCRATFLLPAPLQLFKFLDTYQATLKRVSKFARVASLVIDYEGSERYRIPIDLPPPINGPQVVEDEIKHLYEGLHAGILALHTQQSERRDSGTDVDQAIGRLEELEEEVVNTLSSTPPHEIVPETSIDERNFRQGEYLRKLMARVQLSKSPAYSVLERELENVKKERAELLERMATEKLQSKESERALEERMYASASELKRELEKAESAKRDLERLVGQLNTRLTESTRTSAGENRTLVAELGDSRKELDDARKALESQQVRIKDLETRKELCEQQLEAARIHGLQADETHKKKLGELQGEIGTLQQRLEAITSNPHPQSALAIAPVPAEEVRVQEQAQIDDMEVEETHQPELLTIQPPPPPPLPQPSRQPPRQLPAATTSPNVLNMKDFPSQTEYLKAMKRKKKEELAMLNEELRAKAAADKAEKEHESLLEQERRKTERREAPLTKDFPSSFDLTPPDASSTPSATTAGSWKVRTLVMNGRLLDLAKDNLERNLLLHPEFQRLYLFRLIRPGQKVTQQNAIYRRTTLLPTFYLRPHPEFPMVYGTETESIAKGFNTAVHAVDIEMIDLHKEALERPDHEFGDFVHDTLDFSFLPIKYYVNPATASVAQAKQTPRTKMLLEQYGLIIYWSVIENLNSARKGKGGPKSARKANGESEDTVPARAKKERRNFARHTRAIVIYPRTDPNSPSTGNYLRALSEEYFVRALYPAATQADPVSRQTDTNLLRQSLKPILVPLPYDITQPFSCIAAYARHFMYNIMTFGYAKNRSLATLDVWMDARVRLATTFERTRVKDAVIKESDRIRSFFRKRAEGEPTSVQYELALLNLRKRQAEVRKDERERMEARESQEPQEIEGGIPKSLTDPAKITKLLETTFGPDTRWKEYHYKGLFDYTKKETVGYFTEPVVTSYARLALERVRQNRANIDVAAFANHDIVICNGTHLKELIELGRGGDGGGDPAQMLPREAVLIRKLFRQQGPHLDLSKDDDQQQARISRAKVVIFVMNEQIKEGLPEGQSADRTKEPEKYVQPYLINWLIVITNPLAFRPKALELPAAAEPSAQGGATTKGGSGTLAELKCNILIIDPTMSPAHGRHLTVDAYSGARYDPDKHKPKLTAKQKETEEKKTDAQREKELQNKRKKFARDRANKMKQRMPYGILPQPPGMVPTVKIVNGLEPGEESTPLVNLPGGKRENTENDTNVHYHHKAWAAFALAALVRYRAYSPPSSNGAPGQITPPSQFMSLSHIIQGGERSSKPGRNELSGPKRKDGDSKDLVDANDVAGFLPARRKVIFMNKPLMEERDRIDQLRQQRNAKKKAAAAATTAITAAAATEEVVPTGGEVQQATVANVGKGKKKGAKGDKAQAEDGDPLMVIPKGTKESTVLKNFTIDQSGFRMLECLEFLLPRLRNTVSELDKPFGVKKTTGILAVLKESGLKFLTENIWSTPLNPLQFIVDYDKVLGGMLAVLGVEMPAGLIVRPPQTKVAKKNSVLPAEVEDWQFTSKEISTEIELIRRGEEEEEEEGERGDGEDAGVEEGDDIDVDGGDGDADDEDIAMEVASEEKPRRRLAKSTIASNDEEDEEGGEEEGEEEEEEREDSDADMSD